QPDNTWMTTYLNRAITAQGITEDDDNKEAAAKRAALTISAMDMFQQEQAQRKKNGQPLMNRAETEKFLHDAVQETAEGTKVQDGTTLFGNPKMVAAPKISGMDPKVAQDYSQIRGSLQQQYNGNAPFAPTGAAMADFARRAEQIVPDFAATDF